MWMIAFAVIPVDPGALAGRVDALIDGPVGCYEVVGHVAWNHQLGRFGSTRGSAVLAGRLEDGIWGPFTLFPLGEVDEAAVRTYVKSERFTPLTGRVRRLAVRIVDRSLEVTRHYDEDVAAVATARDVLEQLRGDRASTLEASIASGVTTLVETVHVGRRATGARVEATFREGVPQRWSLTLERPYVHDPLGLARVTDLEVEVLGTDAGLPLAERAMFALSLAGLRATAAQTIHWRSVTPCTVPSGAE